MKAIRTIALLVTIAAAFAGGEQQSDRTRCDDDPGRNLDGRSYKSTR